MSTDPWESTDSLREENARLREELEDLKDDYLRKSAESARTRRELMKLKYPERFRD